MDDKIPYSSTVRVTKGGITGGFYYKKNIHMYNFLGGRKFAKKKGFVVCLNLPYPEGEQNLLPAL